MIQAHQTVVRGDLKDTTVRAAISLASGTEADNELAVARAMYVLVAATSEQIEMKPVAENRTVVRVEVEAAVRTVPMVEVEKAEEAIEVAVVQKVKKALVNEKKVVEPIVDEVVEATVVEGAVKVVKEVATVVETAVDAKEETIESVVTQAEVEEGNPIKIEEPTSKPAGESEVPDQIVVEKEVDDADAPVSPILFCEVPDEKILDKAGDDTMAGLRMPKRMVSIPEDEENVVEVEDEEDVDQVAEETELVDNSAVDRTQEVVTPAKELTAKPATDDESETETQSVISEVTAMGAVESVAVAKTNKEPESEIDETMVFDPAIAAKEAAAIETQASSFSFIPDQLRKNSYTVSSVAVAITTAIVTTLVTRR
ncbi:hypothetical protein PHMEG_00031646 [Phytophthora megakarya]|uniref:Uncharacterized protein n=1 Tax=Phytophthora megakarya TaxID=4795 RepID=A0A225UY52_9STRA|nr:hypothetical protein PHMEG_00031646 [Phytophthora megakarya]